MRPNAEAVLGKALYDAAFDGDARSVAAWLDEGGGVDARCAECGGTTLLMRAKKAVDGDAQAATSRRSGR